MIYITLLNLINSVTTPVINPHPPTMTITLERTTKLTENVNSGVGGLSLFAAGAGFEGHINPQHVAVLSFPIQLPDQCQVAVLVAIIVCQVEACKIRCNPVSTVLENNA